jgi:uncharacterized membrane protein YhiD involved in acid resistance
MYVTMSLFQDSPGVLLSSLGPALGNMATALACGLLISLIYRWTYKGLSYSITFVNSMPPLSMITAMVIMVIGNNIARAFGLVGALSIIRFRTAIKDVQDIVYIFFALAVGMAAGVGLHLTAIAGTIFIGAVILILAKIPYAWPKRREFLLQFRLTSSGEEEAPYLPVLEKYCRQHRLVNVKSLRDSDSLELSYYIRLKADDTSETLVRELGRTRHVARVNVLFDKEQF